MRIFNLVFLLCVLSVQTIAQPVQFNLSNKASFSENGTDTLLYPYTGGLNAPQFGKIDMDGDGIKDLLVFDRVGNKLLTYLYKNGKYIYVPEHEYQFPPLYRWMVLKDYNCDGNEDIFSEVDYNAQPEKDKYIASNGIRSIRNTTTQPGKLSWNQARNQLTDTGLAGLPPVNLACANVDLPAFEDIDADGDIDILLMPFGKNVITYYENMSKNMGHNCDSLTYVFRDECWGYVSYLVNYNGFLLGDNSACYRNYKAAKHNGTSLTLFNPDNDGDMDLIYGDLGYNTLVYLKNGRTVNSLGRDSVLVQDTLFPSNTTQAKIVSFPAAYLLDLDNDGKRDMLVAPNADAAMQNKNQIMYYKNTGTEQLPVFSYQNNSFLTSDMLDLGGGSLPAFCDIDADGDMDLFVTTQGEYTQTNNNSDRIVFFKNNGTPSQARYVLADTNFAGLNINGGAKMQLMFPTFGDLNKDGKPDLLIGDMNGKMHYFENTSSGTQYTFNRKSDDYFSIFAGTYASPQLVDLNKDGKLDIVMGRKNGTLAYFENTGTDSEPQFASTASIDSIGKLSVAEVVYSGGIPFYFDGYSMPHVCDLDKDGNYEVLVGSKTGRVALFRNFEASATRVCDEISGLYSDAAGKAPSDMSFGPRSAAATYDLDNDGKPELLIGNERGGLRMYSASINGVISGIKEQAAKSNELVVYPNPAKDRVILRSDRNLNGAQYRVVDITGHVLQEGTCRGYETAVEVNALVPGFFFLQVTDEGGNHFVARFMVAE